MKVAAHASSRERLWASAELLLAGALVVGANVFDLVPVSETPWLVALGWLSLCRRGLAWRMADTTVSGLLFGMLYLAGGRNLWLPILTHGFSDTIALVLIYLGLVPDLRG